MKALNKIIAGAMCMVIIGSLSACSAANWPGVLPSSQSSSVTSNAAGSWAVNTGALDISENAAAKAAFEKALSGLVGVDYEPLYLLGTQTVAGTNYCILAKTQAVYPGAQASYALVYIYEDLSGNAELSAVTSLADAVGVSDSAALGGWQFEQDDISMAANEGARAAFEAAAKPSGAQYDAIGCLASQVVAGTNYCIACRVQPTAQQDAAELRLVFVYAALDGSAEITSEVPIDISAFEQGSEQ